MTNGRMAVSLKLYSAWSVMAGLAVLSWSIHAHDSWGRAAQENLFFYALALWHGIYAIWFWKGSGLDPFARASVFGRRMMSVGYLMVAILFHEFGYVLSLPDAFTFFFLAYLLLQSATDILGALLTSIALQPDATRVAAARKERLKVEEKNRLLFAVYMTLLGIWIYSGTGSFLSFFHLPGTVFQAWQTQGNIVLFGPIHLLAMQILLLAYFNVVAVRNRLTPLVDAGIRGGLFTCVFFLVLVATGLLHPITLLLPAVDLLSVAWIFLSRTAASDTSR